MQSIILLPFYSTFTNCHGFRKYSNCIFNFLFIHTLIMWAIGAAVEGFTTVILLLLLIGGSIMISLGVIGFYISKIYNEVKGRPQYIITNVCGKSSEESGL